MPGAHNPFNPFPYSADSYAPAGKPEIWNVDFTLDPV